MISLSLSTALGIITGLLLPGIVAYVHAMIKIAKLEAKSEAKDEHLERIEAMIKELKDDIKTYKR